MSFWKLATLAPTLILGACVSTPSPRAAAIAESDDRGVASCTFVATIQGNSMIGGTVRTGAHNAMIDAKEQAAAKGATHIVFVSVDKGGTTGSGSALARAYRCSH